MTVFDRFLWLPLSLYVELLIVLMLTTNLSSSAAVRQGWQFGKSVTGCNRYMLDHQLSTDVIFEVGPPDGARSLIRAHKYVLISRSAVFEAMLFGKQLTDGEQNRTSSSSAAADAVTIQIPAIDPGVFKEILNFIYTDKATISLSNVLPLMYTGKKYHLPKLINDCQRILQTTISADNVCIILDQAIEFEESELINKSVKFIGHNTRRVLASRSFQNLSREALHYILSYDGLRAKETHLFQASLSWARANLKSNQSEQENSTDIAIRETLGDTLYRIRFPTMTLKEFAELAGNSDLLTCSEKSYIYYYIATGNHEALAFDWKKRSIEITVVTRFSSTVTQQWGGNTSPEAIGFACDRNITLTAIGSFGLDPNHHPYGASVTVTIIQLVPNKNDERVHGRNSFPRVLGTSMFRFNTTMVADKIQKIPVDPHIEIQAGITYVIQITMPQNPGYIFYSAYGQGGLSPVTMMDDITFSFSTSTIPPGTPTTVERGQIPSLYYYFY